MAAKKTKAAPAVDKFPKNKILADRRWTDMEHIILDALLTDEDELTVDEAAAKITEYRSREV